MLRKKDFRGQNEAIFDLKYLKNKSIIEQKLLRIMFSTSCNFNFVINGPLKELRGRPYKSFFLNISKTVENFLKTCEQKMLRMKRPFFCYQEKGVSPLKKDQKSIQHIFLPIYNLK